MGNFGIISNMKNMNKHNCSDELRKVNLKVTPARLGVLEALESTNTPLSVGDLIKLLEKENIKADKATVFRTIKDLNDKGLATQIQLNEGKFRYEHIAEDHHHFVCENCGRIEDISDCKIENLEKEIQNEKGFLVKRHSLEFYGLCNNCQN